MEQHKGARPEFEHEPVLLQACIEQLQIKPNGIYIDCTVGGGGHSAAILEQLGSGGRLIGIDKDEDALKAAGNRLNQVKSAGSYTLVHSDFANISNVLQDLNLEKADGILADLGVSSPQLDQAERGFAYGNEGPLDMRMDRSAMLNAETVVNGYPETELARILREYGEERHAGLIAKAIAKQRAIEPIKTTTRLAEIVKAAMPGRSLREQQHPARRTFQAIRIEVNSELAAVEQLLDRAPLLLNPGGRLCIISFHSLEDRLVKEAFRRYENPCICPRDFPICQCGLKPIGRSLYRKGTIASPEEARSNPRARSARLRTLVINEAPET
ncbi:MAG: 16S rRNA (cytosine(1402)-N(4))-methyltransferase RsmH [Ruminococcaceae bacterium]|nr:16S rRNA (cytosine(1402)-N(4))-methyltransferase RsmH [Oscillospiraceae bacterium]